MSAHDLMTPYDDNDDQLDDDGDVDDVGRCVTLGYLYIGIHVHQFFRFLNFLRKIDFSVSSQNVTINNFFPLLVKIEFVELRSSETRIFAFFIHDSFGSRTEEIECY